MKLWNLLICFDVIDIEPNRPLPYVQDVFFMIYFRICTMHSPSRTKSSPSIFIYISKKIFLTQRTQDADSPPKCRIADFGRWSRPQSLRCEEVSGLASPEGRRFPLDLGYGLGECESTCAFVCGRHKKCVIIPKMKARVCVCVCVFWARCLPWSEIMQRQADGGT